MKRIYAIIFIGLTAFFFTSCELDPVNDPNNPSLGSVLDNATKAELQSLVTGLEARHRVHFQNATEMFGSFGREVWAYFGSDPRFVNDWLGIGRTETYIDFFVSVGTYTSPYLAVKHANTLIKAADGSAALTTQEANGYKGFAKTIKAYQLIWPLLQQFQNGIRVDVDDPLNPGPTLGYTQALQAIRAILDEGYNDLRAAGNTFAFALTAGFAGFNTPEGMIKLNRAIAARFALYAEDWQGALNALQESFIDINVDAASAAKMNLGPTLVYGEAPDINNPLFYPYDRPTATILICHPAWVEDALPGDQRVVNKVIRRVANPVTNSGLIGADGALLLGEYQDRRWATNISPIPWLRNEELILIFAEASVRNNKPEDAVNAINIVRNTWGVGNYTGPTDTESLIEEVIFQRRYSLWAEGGHRWVDLRRTGRLNPNYIDLRDQGNIYTQVERRSSEINWDAR
jgi:hypothetical protein